MGSEFVLHLPVAEAQAALVAADSGEPEGAMMMRDNSIAVLVVDDNADAAEMLSEYVGSLGYQVRVAFDGPSALRVAEEMHPAIALLDIGLPVMDGFELAVQMRRAAVKPLRLIALTGYGQDQDRARTTDAGFDAHLVKPVEIDDLDEVISGLATV